MVSYVQTPDVIVKAAVRETAPRLGETSVEMFCCKLGRLEMWELVIFSLVFTVHAKDSDFLATHMGGCLKGTKRKRKSRF
jgi:hypothetical protein